MDTALGRWWNNTIWAMITISNTLWNITKIPEIKKKEFRLWGRFKTIENDYSATSSSYIVPFRNMSDNGSPQLPNFVDLRNNPLINPPIPCYAIHLPKLIIPPSSCPVPIYSSTLGRLIDVSLWLFCLLHVLWVSYSPNHFSSICVQVISTLYNYKCKWPVRYRYL